MKLLLYCTKAKPYLYYAQESRTLMDIDNSFEGYKTTNKNVDDYINGKIVAECDFEVEKINVFDCTFRTFNLVEKEILNKSCLTYKELFEYLKNRDNPRGYAIHIKNLHIFDKPREFSKCYYLTLEKGFLRQIKKAPQNMCYALTTRDDKDILISIKPEWLCKILNGEKTIEVRKKVLKGMLD